MVRSFKRFAQGVILASLASLVSLTSLPILAAQAEVRQIMLGESVSISLSGAELFSDYAQLDLSPIQRHFHIDDTAQTSQRIRLRLTPLQAGRFDIPRIQAGNLVIPAQSYEVRDNPQVRVEWDAVPASIWQGQTITQRVELVLSNPDLPASMGAREISDTNNATHQRYSAQPISQTLAETKSMEFVHVTQLLLDENLSATHTAHTIERISLPQPWVQVQNRQGGRWLFYAPSRQVELQPLPHYLPADLAVGQFELTIERPFWHRLGELHYQTLRITGYQANRLPLIADWLDTSNPSLERLHQQRQTETTLTEAGLVLQQTLTQPYRLNKINQINQPGCCGFGLGQFAEIRLNVFEPETGKLNTLVIPAQTYWLLPAWVYQIGWGLLMLLSALMLWGLFKLGRVAGLWLRLHWQLRRANTPQQQWQAYQNWAQQRGLGVCQTHQAWLNAYQAKLGDNAKLINKLNQINQSIYQR